MCGSCFAKLMRELIPKFPCTTSLFTFLNYRSLKLKVVKIHIRNTIIRSKLYRRSDKGVNILRLPLERIIYNLFYTLCV